MEVTSLGYIFAILVLSSLVATRSLVPVLFVSAIFQGSAAMSVAGVYIAPFHLVGILVCASLLLRFKRNGPLVEHSGETKRAMYSAFAWSMGVLLFVGLATAWISPQIFSGLEVFSPTYGIDTQVGNLTPLSSSSSNFAQSAYLIISLGIVVYLMRARRVRLWLSVMFFLGISMSAVSVILGESAIASQLDRLVNNRTDRYVAVYESRARGIFNEPSDFGMFAGTATVYFFVNALTSRGTRRGIHILGAGLSVWSLVSARSGSAVLGLIISIIILSIVSLISVGTRFSSLKISITGIFLGCGIMFGLALLVANRGTSILEFLTDKTQTGSFDSRSAADSTSLGTFLATGGLGAGLGSVRASSFVITQLATVGVLGTAALFGLIYIAVRSGLKSRFTMGAAAALLTIVTIKSVAGPDLSSPWMWVLIGVSAGAIYMNYLKNDLTESNFDKNVGRVNRMTHGHYGYEH